MTPPAIPPATLALMRSVVAHVVPTCASDASCLSIREAREYLVRRVLHYVTPHGAWARCPVPLGELIEEVERLVSSALADQLVQSLSASDGGGK